ncbi:hypothetical protein DFQ27_001171, partial [Actinomortierella ambigua]
PSFSLGRQIGSGGYGQVFLVEWGGIACAAKKLFVTLEEFHQEQIQKKVSIVHKLRHRNVIQLYTTHEHDDCFYLIMDLAEKGNLATAIDRKQLDWKAKTRIIHQLTKDTQRRNSISGGLT